ncbi:UvrB/UvrC motif-containing protein [Candidatus Berkelbacteria bacterium]|nr:UvrB/UvrC motif-containing protein [Candidatus Berkelbacteria bacterium]
MKKTFKVSAIPDLPRVPGVYYYYDSSNNLLYIGKATSLKSRVSSYWQRPADNRIASMVTKIATIKIKVTDSALEALILEANEINRLQPPFNVRGKDSKTFAQIALTKEDFPRFIIVRPTQKTKFKIDRTFGPYVSAFAARRALKSLREIFKFNCRGKAGSGRSCLYRELGFCPGVCTGDITPSEYKKIINRVVQFLEGKKDRIIKTTKKLMTEAAKRKDYEKAAAYRDELFALTHIRDTAFMTDDATSLVESSLPARLEAYDISNLGNHAAVGSMIVLEHGRSNPAEYRMFKIRSVRKQNDIGMLREVLTRRLRHKEWPMPEFIFVDGGITQRQIAERVLKRFKLDIPVAGVSKGPKRKLAKIVASEKARKWLNDRRLTNQLMEPIARLARDEAHRFAINYHRKLRAQSIN